MTTLNTLVNNGTIDLNTNNILNVSVHEITPVRIAFNNDGSKMFIVGYNGQDVNEYTLSTEFDVSTATFNDINGNGTGFSISTQETKPSGIAFNNDGTKMFIVGYNSAINVYSLSTGFDLSSASFTFSYSVSTQETAPAGIAFNNDGTKMFIVGSTNGGVSSTVNEYTLSIEFDLDSTVNFIRSFSISAQETSPTGIAFNNDGTKMFIVGFYYESVYEYTLSTGYDVSTASFVVSFSVFAQDANPKGIAFNNNGTKMFIVGTNGKDVNEYTLSTGFDLTTIPTILNNNYSLSTDLTIGTGQTLTIDSGITLKIDSGQILTIDSGGTLIIGSGGTLIINLGGTLTDNGTLTNNGALIDNSPGIYTPPIICFPRNTPVTTDQGNVLIQDLENKPYTIDGNKVLGIVNMTSNEAMVYFKQNSLAYNVPSKNTYITQSHVIYHNNTQLKAIDYTKKDFHKRLCTNSLKGIKQEKPILVKVENNKVYNVVLESGHKMKVNNMLVETLHPSNELYKQKLLK